MPTADDRRRAETGADLPPGSGGELLAALVDLTTLACSGVPGCRSASVMMHSEGELRSLAASEVAATEMDHAQCDLGDGPCVRALAAGEQVGVVDYRTEERWTPLRSTADRLGIRSSLSLPLRDDQRVLGALNMYGTDAAAFGEESRHLAELLVRQAAAALSYLALLETERAARLADRRTTETLQLGMVSSVSELPGITCAARSLTGLEEAHVGGDWYDVFPLPDGAVAVAVAVGDAMGHDAHAAVAMSQLRSVLRSYAYDGGSPSAVLDRLDRLVQGFDMTPFATAFYGRLLLDRDGAMLVFGNAGHPPPLLLLPDGSVQQLQGGASHVIGAPLPGGGRADAGTLLPSGSTLVLFTDGLVERRDLDLGSQLTLLAQTVATHAPTDPPDALCDRLLSTLLPDGHTDDVTVLALRID